jgi:hypothetical protein
VTGCLEEVWTHLQFVLNACENGCVMTPLLSCWFARGSEGQFDDFVGFKRVQVGMLAKEVELRRGSRACNKFGPSCASFQMHMRMCLSPSPCQFLCLLGALEDGWMIS